MVVSSDRIKQYLDGIEEGVLEEYEVAEEARAMGYDPEDKVDIPLANDVADRCEGIVGAVAPEIVDIGVKERIRELEEEYGSSDWRIAFIIAAEIAQNEFHEYESVEDALEVGVRIGLAYITLGVTCAPLEGFIELKLKERRDGGDYCAVYYAGPIRSAGGTASAVSVLIADYARRSVGVGEYDPQPVELKRYDREIKDYDERISRLQYSPTKEEIEFMVKNVPVEINGDPTSRIEVSNYKRLDRVETDLIRGGMCLVIGEGLSLKAKKIIKRLKEWGEDFGMQDWLFLEDYVDMQKMIHSTGSGDEDDDSKVKPNTTFIEELVAGRPVFSHPMRPGGFRLRYGRSRLSGLAAASMHPCTMSMTYDFIATGVQLKVERPGKACAITPCDSVQPPLVKLSNGDVLWLDTEEKVKEFKSSVKEVIFGGDILFCYGDFVENGSMLVPPGYVQEWWVEDLKQALEEQEEGEVLDGLSELFENPVTAGVSLDEAVQVSEEYGVPLHPGYVFFWKNIRPGDLNELIRVLESTDLTNHDLVLPSSLKSVLEDLWIEHRVSGDDLIVSEGLKKALLVNLGFDHGFSSVSGENVLGMVNELSDFEIRDVGGTFVGCRMGRPEKAKMRKLKGSPQGLFPVGSEGGRLRSFNTASEEGEVNAVFPLFYCPGCDNMTIYRRCEECGERTVQWYYCSKCGEISDKEECCGRSTKSYNKRGVDINHYIRDVITKTGLQIPDLVKGVRGVMGKGRLVEHFMKAFLRSKNDVYVNKDGTIRYDIIETPITHFTPEEIGLTVERAKELGYARDVNGEPLQESSQLVELLPQDIILPDCSEWDEADSADFLLKVCDFVDDELEFLYELPKYFNAGKKSDLIGEYVVSLAPHTSAGIVSRIIGFSDTQGFYAHPYLHAACRRNADGDELGIILLMDALLNFSRQFLPDRRGGRSVSYDTQVYCIKNGSFCIKRIGELVDEAVNESSHNRDGYEISEVGDLKVFSFNPSNRRVESCDVTKLIRHESPYEMVKVRTTHGEITTTKDHSLFSTNGEFIESVSAGDLSEGDAIIVPRGVKFEEVDFFDVDIASLIPSELYVEGFESELRDSFDSLDESEKERMFNKWVDNNVYSYLNGSRKAPYLFCTNLGVIPDRVSLEKGAVVNRVFTANEDFFKLLAYLIAEGYYESGEVVNTDESIVSELVRVLRELYGFEPKVRVDERDGRRPCYSVVLPKVLMKAFFKLGLSEGEARSKTLPSFLFTAPDSCKMSFLKAYVNCDGHYYSEKNFSKIYTSSEWISGGVSLLARTLGLKSGCRKVRGGKYEVSFSELNKGDSFQPLRGYTRNLSTSLNHGVLKQEMRLLKDSDLRVEGVVSVEEVPSCHEFVYDLEVPGFQNFLCGPHPIFAHNTMDAPLVLSVKLDPVEVDSEAFNMDITDHYPLRFYEAACDCKMPWDVDVKRVEQVLNTEEQYEGLSFTHASSSVNNGPFVSAYKSLESMSDKMNEQLKLAKVFRAVDEDDVARLIIEKHFLKDLKGNLRRYSTQGFRCVNCNEKYRRPPLSGKCNECGGKIILTIAEGSVKKYLKPCMDLKEEFDIPEYLGQDLMLLERKINGLFGKPPTKQIGLNDV